MVGLNPTLISISRFYLTRMLLMLSSNTMSSCVRFFLIMLTALITLGMVSWKMSISFASCRFFENFLYAGILACKIPFTIVIEEIDHSNPLDRIAYSFVPQPKNFIACRG